ncbi:MAG: 2-hydroxyacid dehydrogenase [Pseudomonadota bacterium]|nr:2-hydroxyacid dehydrogenase [Pseudomonadota bacterium]
MPAPIRVLYNSLGTPDMYALIRAELPPGFELVTLERDDDAERIAKAADAEVIIVAAKPLTRLVIDAAAKLRLVHHQGVGYHDTVDVAALRDRGIALALTPAGTTIGVAEHAVLLALAAARRLPFADAELRQGRWHVNSLRPVSMELAGKTVGYVGMGRIGQAAAARFRAFDTRGLYFDPKLRLNPGQEAALGLEPAPLDRLLAESDVVTLHVPLTVETRHLIGQAELARMKPDSILVNTARGGVIDEAALVEALREGRIGAAGLDVFETEPLPAGHPLAAFPNVVLTPHISAGTRDALRAKMRALFANVAGFFAGKPLENEVALARTAAE